MTRKFEAIPDAEAIAEGDLERELPFAVREVLLDVILTWANLEMVTGFFVAQVLELNPDEGADKFGRKEIADKLKRASKALQEAGNLELAKQITEIANAYPEKALLRRRIAHSKCAGVRKSLPDRVVFLPYEREGPPEHLALEVIHISKFNDAVEWARDVHDHLLKYVDNAGFFLPGVR
ncbi:MAG: hypothetical protein KKD64_13240 [Alphaproteobacteria bacterium]|nr:hypothetical protein [Alphaproteobacteria bacterium]MBU0793126.1 hypothetical protein [Alphaproteobacteria bacterium]MBU0877251.1 hypothetical protein [Alphaproteobacteria bacterium]MBU1770599.1 hypothetical protein [Alphaproteobacteria bacterium]